jgi:hypothetical protein
MPCQFCRNIWRIGNRISTLRHKNAVVNELPKKAAMVAKIQGGGNE